MTQLAIKSSSTIDHNLEQFFNIDADIEIDDWIKLIESLPGVISAEWVRDHWSYTTVITFESEQHKNWFLLQWS
jgi:hypothetical protein